MKAPSLFRDRSRPAQAIAAGLIPAAIGSVAGVLIGVSAPAYWVVALLAAVGGIAAGFEHLSRREAAVRGLVGGAIYGAALLAVHDLAGTHEKVSLGSFPPALVVVTAGIGMALTALGAEIRRHA